MAGAILNPVLIIEVLSPSIERYDREEKFIYYRSIPGFKEYAVVRQDAPEVITFFRETPDTWKEKMTRGIEESVHFRSIDVDLALQLVYRNIGFDR